MTGTINFLSREKLQEWLAGLMEDNTVIAPVHKEGLVLFDVVSSVSDVAWDGGRTDMSAKDFFLPGTELMMSFSGNGSSLQVQVPDLSESRVLFAARPCDAHGLRILDELFANEEPADPYYSERRRRTTIIGLSCPQAFEGCFCTAVGGGPHDRSNVDILLTEMDGGYAVDAVTGKGEILLSGLSLEQFEKTPPPPPEIPALPLASTEVWKRNFDNEFWLRISENCIGCRLCTYDCPVCYCFDVRDYPVSDGVVERIRAWDSCQSASCYKLAGGHNSRPTQRERLRQRFFHKFLYYRQRYGTPLCVGCGRCVSQCPVNIDIREVITSVSEMA